MELGLSRKGHVLSMDLLNIYSTKFCEKDTPHDYNQCLLWHANMSPFFSEEEVRFNHLRREPIINTRSGKILRYKDEKCVNGGGKTCPDGESCDKCHNEKEFMYHPLIYMTTECRNHRNKQCLNRTCAFYHSESQRKEAEENREQLIKEIRETENRLQMNEGESNLPINVDINSANHFPSLPESDITIKPSPIVKRSYAETAKASVRSNLTTSSSSISTISNDDNNNTNDNDNNNNNSNNNSNNINNLDSSTIEHERPPLLSTLNNSSKIYSPSTSVNNNSLSSGFTASTGSFVTPESAFGNALTSSTDFSFTAGGSGNVFWDKGFSTGTPSYFGEPFALGSSQFQGSFSNVAVGKIHDCLEANRSKKLAMNYHYVIYEGIWLEHNEEKIVCVKEIDLNRVLDRSYVLDCIDKIPNLNHKNLVKYYASILSVDRLFVVMDSHKETLQSYIKTSREKLIDEKGNLTKLCISFIVQLCSLFEYFYKNNMIHRNLDPSNIYIEKHSDNNHQIILGDFDYPTQHRPNDLYNNSDIWESPEERRALNSDNLLESDMWRLGILIYYMITGTEPDIINPSFTALDNYPYWQSLVVMLLQVDYIKRLSAAKLLDHPVFWISSPQKILRFISQSLKLISQPLLDQMCSSLNAIEWFGRHSWKQSLSEDIYNIVPEYSSYEGNSVIDLLKVIIVTFKQIQLLNNENDEKIQNLRKRALSLLTNSGHPILYFHDLFPLLVLKLWRLLYSKYQLTQSKIEKISTILSCGAF